MRRKPDLRKELPLIVGRPDRKLRDPVASLAERQAFALRVIYNPYAKHKKYPDAYGLKPYEGKGDRTYCDAHAKFSKADFGRIGLLLERAALSGSWSEDVRDDVPAMLWTVDDNGWVYELYITNHVQADYHGYPLMPVDPFARLAIARVRDWYDGLDPAGKTRHSGLIAGLSLAQTKYSGK